jgi:signal peptidase
MSDRLCALARLGRRGLEAGLFTLILVALFGVVLARGVPLLDRTLLVVSGPSMEPAIGRGAAIVLEPVVAADLRVGDVVSLRLSPGSAVVTHRISRIVALADGTWLETRGDANPAPDPVLVPPGAVIGRVGLTMPWAGYLVALLSLPSGLAMLAGIAGLLLSGAVLLETFERPVTPPAREAERPSRRPMVAKA